LTTNISRLREYYVVPLMIDAVNEVLSKYGGRAYYVLKAAVEVTEELRSSGVARLGDFDYRSLVAKLRSWGLDYNPSNLLRVLEREYRLVKTVYRSSNQRWWVFTDYAAVKLALGDEGVLADPDEELLALQIAIVDVDRLATELGRLVSKERLGATDERRLREIVLVELPQIIEVYKRALNYGDKYADFLAKVRRVVELARKAVALTRRDGHLGVGSERAQPLELPVEGGVRPHK